ncbi:hypothetical protein [Psychrobacter sp. HII-4]|uniref:hypothetical protein n=1 Tax=Psychrobacter sp. HII-4 TaxID=1569264 RepID=UPI00191B2032|nr:hypothetical protein [Psychrobacter sp. HII-4]
MKHKEILYLSSESKLDFQSFFDGYAFFGIDLVIGNQGFQQLSKKTDNRDKYEDGNYLLIERQDNDSYQLSRDYHGYYPIFYYQSEDYWCISNSIIYMVERLKEQGRSISFNAPNVEIWKSHLAFALQLTSHHTFVNEIKVLPVNSDIVITKDHANSDIALVKREPSPKHKQSYREALIECLEVWRGRYLTIMSNNKIALHHDLTGGLDSRCLLSFIVSNIDAAKGANQDNQLRINSESQHTEDFKIAKRLVSLFDLSVNAKINDDYKSASVDASESYAVWKYFNIGRYAPIIFRLTDFSPHYLEMGGEGGEDNRAFYVGTAGGKYRSLPEYLERYKPFFTSETRYLQWIDQVNQSAYALNHDYHIGVSILHYREFRSNHHTAKNPKSRFKVAPLGSKYFDRLCQLSDDDALQSGQVFYDVLYNNHKKLLYIPFDRPSKAIKDKNIKKLTVVEAKKAKNPGMIYWSDDETASDLFCEMPIESSDIDVRSPLQILHDEALASLNNNQSLIEYYFGKPAVAEFYKCFESIDFKKARNNLHSQGSFLHALMVIQIISEAK